MGREKSTLGVFHSSEMQGIIKIIGVNRKTRGTKRMDGQRGKGDRMQVDDCKNKRTFGREIRNGESCWKVKSEEKSV